MLKNIDKEITTETFDYGNHTIHVKIKVTYENRSRILDNVLNHFPGSHYYRVVETRAYRKDTDPEDTDTDADLKRRTFAVLDTRKRDESLWFGPIRLIESYNEKQIPDIPEQVEKTVKPVLEELDKLYTYTAYDTDIDIEIGMDRVRHEISWAEVDDEATRIAQELGNITPE